MLNVFQSNHTAPFKGIVSLYGKVGCKGNARQMKELKAAGYVVQFIDLLSRELEANELKKFFAGHTVHECVNRRAPQITDGSFQPEELDEEALLQAMIQAPILIKRPLIFFRGEFACGFDHPLLERLLGAKPKAGECQHHAGCHHSDPGSAQ